MFEILEKDEWNSVPVSYHGHTVLKIEETKFFSCPLCCITSASWELIRQVNLCINSEGDIIHLPEPHLSVLDQSPRFLAAVEMVRQERNSDWYHKRIQDRARKTAQSEG